MVYEFGVDFSHRTSLVEKQGRMMPVREVVLEEREPSDTPLEAAL